MSELKYKIPVKLCAEARGYMKGLMHQLHDQQIGINGLDFLALDQLAWTIHTYSKARAEVMKEGYVVKETNARNTTIRKPHPAVKIMYDSNAQMIKLLMLFGLTPKSRGNVNALQGKLPMSPGLDKFKLKIS